MEFSHKIQVPQRHNRLISRPRLNEFLDNIAERRLVTITGPAGYGKTSLLIDYVATTSLPVCWYSVDVGDADPRLFIEYLAAAIECRFLGAISQVSTLLSSGQPVGIAEITNAICRDIYAISRDFIMVVDDWHLIDHIAAIREIVGQILARCPRCHFIIASRNYPNIPNLMLLTARREMLSLTDHQLRFMPDEVVEVLRAEYLLDIPLDQATSLTEQSNGWITGVMLSYQACALNAVELPLSSVSADRQIYSFLAEQVFEQQPEQIGSFLLASSLLEDLNPTDCDSFLDRNDSRQMLDQLLRRHLFANEIKPGLLRYHPLFREFLQEHFRTVDPAGYQKMMQRLASFYTDRGNWQNAFESYISAGNQDGAEQVLRLYGETLYTSGRTEILKNWFAALGSYELNASLLCLKARLLFEQGTHHEAWTLVQMAELRMQPKDQPAVWLLQADMARRSGHYRRSLTIAQQVCDAVSEGVQRAQALRLLGICRHRLGQTSSAIETFHEARRIFQEHGDLHALAQIRRDLGICHKELGQLELAEEYFTQSDAYYATIGNPGRRAMSLNSKGTVQHLTGRYHAAHATFVEALQCARVAAQPSHEAVVLSCLGDLYADVQQWERARVMYEDARQIRGNAQLHADLEIGTLTLLVRQHKADEAARALRQLSDVTRSTRSAAVHFLAGSIACQRGEYERASAEYETLAALVAKSDSLPDKVRACLLQAQLMTMLGQGQSRQLAEPLEMALRLTKQIGHPAFLAVETLYLRHLLHRALALGWAPAHDLLQLQQDILHQSQMLVHDDQRPTITVRTLGADQIFLNGKPIDLGWQKAREVFFYLLAHRTGVALDRLREEIWPDLSVERSKEALRSAIYQLRSVLPRDLIVLQNRQTYLIDSNVAHIDYDVERFLLLSNGREEKINELFEVVHLYRGHYLPSTSNDWSTACRTMCEQRYLQVLHLLGREYEQAGDYSDALEFYRRILAINMFEEGAHAGVMRCQIELGNRAAAIQQYKQLRELLDNELGIDLDKESDVELLYSRILAS